MSYDSTGPQQAPLAENSNTKAQFGNMSPGLKHVVFCCKMQMVETDVGHHINTITHPALSVVAGGGGIMVS